MSVFRLLFVCVVIAVGSGSNLPAHTPVEFLEVLSVQPARKVEHAIDLKSKFDASKRETQLDGPLLFSRSVGCLGRAAMKQPAYLNWYKIVDPIDEPVRTVSVLDTVRGSANKSLQIRSAEYFLAPSQRITTGPPDAIPGGLDQYKAYRVIDSPAMEQDVKLTSSTGPEDRQLGKPLFVCVPAEEWHHESSFGVTHADACLVVYELDSKAHVETFATIDEFGLNELESDKSQWLCVSGVLLRSPAKQ